MSDEELARQVGALMAESEPAVDPRLEAYALGALDDEELAQLEAEGLVYTERTTGRFVTEDTALLEQLRDETARAMTAEYLEKMRGIGYGPAEAAKLMTGWETKESDSNE